ncbi:hypothetical protein SCHPADRAFT_283259 [Schizopora paradoxa]|uniref:PhoX domain-containing protein n=1 Tax=Schizopora paradoxa TaxID=27342 RepID=A0A0H2SDI9_9AGAM|nr:hypothetical protein SCHPADRAFT_283259 [Schizopora paradoxa]
MVEFGSQTAIGVGVLAILIPVCLRVLSPWTVVFFLFPTLLFLVGFACLFATVIAGYFLDKYRPTKHRNELSSIVRPLAFSTPAAWQAVQTRSRWSYKSPQNLSPLRPDFPVASAAINDILILIVRDFVLTWYRDLSDSPSFPAAVSECLHDTLDDLLERLANIDLSSFVVRRVFPKLTIHVDQFRHSETTLRGAGLERHLTQSEELDLLLASRYVGKGGALHPAVDNLSSTFTKQTEESHLRKLVDAALPVILPAKDAKSKALHIVVREIVACAVLAPITEMLSDPDFWNRTIEQLAGAAIRQQKLISKVRSVLEIQSLSPAAQPSKDGRHQQHEVITMRTDPRHFEGFLRSISRCNSLLDARRLKNDIVGEIRRTRTLLASHENEDWINGHKTEDVVAFLDRLYTAKRKIEKRIVLLGGQDEAGSISSSDNARTNFSLRDVLGNPSSLSHFMEFMDRRGRSLLVQFWLTVESFKNPLESLDSDTDADEDAAALQSGGKTLQEDLTMINDLYFSQSVVPQALSMISRKHVDAVRAYAGKPSASFSEERKARRAVMRAQKQVEQEMENEFEEFKRSDLWFRAVSDLEIRPVQEKIVQAPALSSKPSQASSATGILSSFVQGLTSDKHVASTNPRQIPRVASASAALPVVTKSNLSREFERPELPYPAPGAGRSVSAQAPSHSMEVLMSPSADSDSGSARAPLFDEAEDGTLLSADADEAQRMEAIHAAVTDIIASENRLSVDEGSGKKSRSEESLQNALFPPEDKKSVGGKGVSGYFDGALDGIDEDNATEANEVDEMMSSSFHPAGPGDLHLSNEISRLGEKIGHLQSQDVILDTLIRKAELTGDAQELKLLRRSKSALVRELRQLVFQKSQYEQQDMANKLIPGRTNASIVNSTVGEEDGKSVVRYLIEVQQLGPDGSFASGWVVARRYSEFLFMHQHLRDQYLPVKNLDFPGKRLLSSSSAVATDSRRVGLEKYLQNLLIIPMVCESQELRTFLSRESPFMTQTPSTSTSSKDTPAFLGHNIVRSVVKSFTESIDDMFFGPSMLDVMIGRLTRQAAEFAGIVGTASTDEDLVTQALKASGKSVPEETLIQLPGDLKPLEGETSSSSFTAPICDFILSLFELDKKNNWLRRQAIVIILQQVLGDTIERKFRDTVKAYLDESHLMTYINIFKDGLWPGGKLKASGPPRTVEEKARTRDEANRKLSTLLPDVAANMMGRSNARRGARRMFAVLQNRRLNQHIVYTILDEVFIALFPELPKPTS